MDNNPLVGVLVGLVTASSIYVWKSDEFNKTQKTLLLICLLFPPLQWVMILVAKYYNNLAYKKSKEYTHYTKERKIDNSKSTLKELKDGGIITEEEYKEKVEKINKQKTELNILNSREYTQLKSLFESNILTKEEFENKVNILNSNSIRHTDINYEQITPKFSPSLEDYWDENKGKLKKSISSIGLLLLILWVITILMFVVQKYI